MYLTILSRYFHTLRFLKFQQIFYRLRSYFPKGYAQLANQPPVRDVDGLSVEDVVKSEVFSLPDKFNFLNQTGHLAEIGWRGEERSDLWRYNQHYFDWLGAQLARNNPDAFNDVSKDWLIKNPSAIGPAWDPYPTSLRIVNWCKFHWRSDSLTEEMISSLALQAHHLHKTIEWHLMANHLFANGKALIFAGIFFDGRESNHWLKDGIKIISRQLDEQILADGAHFELSPMYHSIILEDCLDLLNLLGQSNMPQAEALVRKLHSNIPLMFNWLSLMSFSDGKISFFNDATFDIASDSVELRNYAHRLGLKTINFRPGEDSGVHYLEHSGYVRINKGAFELIFDVGEVGPTYQPGHAHADTLSIELAVNSKRLIVNSGISTYGISSQRHTQRSTGLHNTVEIEGYNSSEVWSGFRVARRASPFDLSIDKENALLTCSHDGYRRLPGKPVHTRHIECGEDEILVNDTISSVSLNAVAKFHIHPDWQVQETNKGIVCRFNEQEVFLSNKTGEFVLEKASYHPGFNLIENSVCLSVPLRQGMSSLSIRAH